MHPKKVYRLAHRDVIYMSISSDSIRKQCPRQQMRDEWSGHASSDHLDISSLATMAPFTSRVLARLNSDELDMINFVGSDSEEDHGDDEEDENADEDENEDEDDDERSQASQDSHNNAKSSSTIHISSPRLVSPSPSPPAPVVPKKRKRQSKKKSVPGAFSFSLFMILRVYGMI